MKYKGFGLIQTIIIILVVGGILTMALKYASLTSKQTADSYEREGAELFLNSAIESSLLAIEGYNRKKNNNCLSHIKIISLNKRFIADINITDYFLYDTGKSDDAYHICKNSENGYTVHKIYTKDSQGMVMINIVVESNDTNPKNNIKVRLLRRSLQRP